MTKIKKSLMKTTKTSYIKGSRVPVEYLIDYISEGYSLTEFLSAYPWVKKASAKKALEELKKSYASGYAL